MPRRPTMPPPMPGPPIGRPKAMDPAKAVMAAPRIKPTSTRAYGKGGSPMSGAPDMGIRGGGIGYGGFKPYGT
jgi:hypothetical protein